MEGSDAGWLRALVDHSVDVLILFDAAGSPRFVSAEIEHLLGYTPEEFLAREDPSSDVHPEDEAGVRALFRSMHATPGARVAVEARLQRKDGRMVWVEAHAVNLLDDPEVRGLLASVRDIGDRKSSARALDSSERRFRHLIEQAADAFYLHDVEGRILDVNQHACDALGYSRQEMLGMTIFDIEIGVARESLREQWRQMKPAAPITVHGVQRRKDGSRMPVEVRIGVFDEDGARRFLALSRDTSERVRAAEALQHAKEEAERASRVKTAFLSNMSHELRTPLNAIVGFGKVLSKGTYGPLNDRQVRYLEQIQQASEHMRSLIDDLLDLRRIEEDRADIMLGPTLVRAALKEAVGLVLPMIDDRRHTLEIVVPEDLPEVVGNRRALVQVLTNVLSNAAKFTPEGGRITVCAIVADPHVRIEVTDTGVGIAPEDQVRLFDYFEQLGAKHEHHMKGSGIGLALTRALVTQMSGTIDLSSEVGRGTTFFIHLPALALPRQTIPMVEKA